MRKVFLQIRPILNIKWPAFYLLLPMDLRSNYPYWLLRHGIIESFPSLQENVTTQIAIMGGGISGALTAWHLQNAGFDVVLVDRRHIGMGSTAASTALLQYEIDVPLHKLIKKVGEKNAVQSYLLCRQAIDDIEDICTKLKAKGVFERKPSLQYASYKKDYGDLREEYEVRKKNGIPLQWLEKKEIRDKFGFSKSAALLSKDGAGLDAYQLTHLLLANSIRKGLRVFDHTEVVDIHHGARSVELLTADGKKIRAKKLVIACGYESQRYIPMQVQQLHSTYAIVTEPFIRKEFWYRNALIWETAEPYLYMRTTSDNRILMGGKDIPFSDPFKRDNLIYSKTKALEKSFHDLFPSIPFKTDFKWAGTFASTRDGLPFIGSIRQRPHTYFSLGFGGNGITFSIIAAQIIRDELKGKKNENSEIFRFDR
ncbi:MAG: FAD-dependent oxidoreductase [Chitinophagaceae bacterium]